MGSARFANYLAEAGLMTAPMEVLTLLRECSGFQLISEAFLMACAANFGVVIATDYSAVFSRNFCT